MTVYIKLKWLGFCCVVLVSVAPGFLLKDTTFVLESMFFDSPTDAQVNCLKKKQF